ncbi:MAG: hypothetical protein Ct9H300mP20_02610 [Gammaproteobacteria bacterium]|nr:MAG: hypothetical protein Ct9H300mP20_02610 [Gammaproteobacteria bacterium]
MLFFAKGHFFSVKWESSLSRLSNLSPKTAKRVFGGFHVTVDFYWQS